MWTILASMETEKFLTPAKFRTLLKPAKDNRKWNYQIEEYTKDICIRTLETYICYQM